ncbi:hypothetical protein [Austwickia sp. TVS 96-490-7B]|uniref:hypothetical protein n=1 Tax=Austwickia sp. TVS 96-490-7B TaxID=2830843 RepID=UPI001C58A763|nr:hypothetical protein [Austwickia sp. TVS 96-490-7B]
MRSQMIQLAIYSVLTGMLAVSVLYWRHVEDPSVALFASGLLVAASVVLSPLVAAMSAHSTAALGKLLLLTRGGARSWWRVWLSLTWPLGSGILIGWAAMVLTAQLRLGIHRGQWLYISYVTLSLFVLLEALALGSLMGSLLPKRPFAPIIALAGYYLLISQVFAPPLSARVEMILDPAKVIWHGVMAMSLLIAASSFRPLGYWPSLSLHLRNTLMTFFVALMLVTGSVQASDISRPREVSEQSVACSSHFCVWPEHEKYLSTLESGYMRLSSNKPQWLKQPSHYRERGITKASGDHSFSIPPEWAAWASMADAMISATQGTGCLDQKHLDLDKYSQAYMELSYYLTVQGSGNFQPADVHGGPPIDVKSISEIALGQKGDQKTWLAERNQILTQGRCGMS